MSHIGHISQTLDSYDLYDLFDYLSFRAQKYGLEGKKPEEFLDRSIIGLADL